MRRHPNLQPVSRQHRKMLMLAQLLKKGAPPYKGLPQTPEGKIEYAIGLFVNLIEKHFEIEEHYLFNTLAGTEELNLLVEELKADHQLLKEQFHKLNPLEPDLELMDELGQRLEKHIRKEEREYFQRAQQEKKEVLQTLSLPLENE